MPVHSKLRGTIVQLASDFAEGVLEALRNVSLEDLLAEAAAPGARSRPASARARTAEPTKVSKPAKPGRGRRLARRSPADIAHVVDRVVALLAQHPKGLRSEEIQAKLGLAAKEMPRPLADALAAHRITRQGQKRATTYLAGKPGAPKAVGKPARKATKARKSVRAKAAKPGKAGKKAPAPARAKPGKPAPNGAHVTKATQAVGAPS
jgi:hypothetical protein